MATGRERAPLSTEVSPVETEADPDASGHCESTREAETRTLRGGATHSVQSEVTPSDQRLVIGQTLSGRYRIERELGEGGMGVVYLVTDEQVAGETFAVKVLKEGLDPEALSLLREEVRKTRKLSHPNTVDVHSVNVDGTRLYVLMEYLEGKSLNALLDEEFGRGMAFSHAWPIIEDVGAALGNAHDHNVIHSDLKPANVFVTTSGRTKLLDFGIARVSRGPLLRRRSGLLALTPAYASCEMLEGKEADARDDIYSFACVIYEMLCGKRPFGDVDALEAREAGAQVPALAVLSREQNAALAQALAFERKDRTASVEQLLETLADRKPRAPPSIAVLAGSIIAAVAALGMIFWALDKLAVSRHAVVVQSQAEPAAARAPATPNIAPFNPPPHSIAVLPFVNMSGDKDQEYFSDGLTEEIVNSLARINDLQVSARTSSFSFKGKDADISTIGHKLNVASVLEGSVRRAGNTVRVTVQLNNAVTGFHLWSQTYDRDLSNVLQLQTEIATAVVTALKVTLIEDLAAKIELGGTHNPASFDAYLRAMKVLGTYRDGKDMQTAIAEYTEAIRLDPSYALAYTVRSYVFSGYAGQFATGPAIRESFDNAQSDAHKAVALAPDLAEGHLALAYYFQAGALDFTRANEEYERALALTPGNARVLGFYGPFAVFMGRTEAGIAAARRAVELDPLNRGGHYNLGLSMYFGRRNREALAAFQEALALYPDDPTVHALRGLAYYALGEFERARTSCESKPDDPTSQLCLAVTYDKLGRHTDAESTLAKLKSSLGDAQAYQYAEIYAHWGNTPRALEWLETALRLRDPGLAWLKVDPLLDPLRKEPRFQAVERALRFPD
jgi:serine/threonine-protein kinase